MIQKLLTTKNKNMNLNFTLQPTNTSSGYGMLNFNIVKSMLYTHNVNLQPLNPVSYLQNIHEIPHWYREFCNNYKSNRIPVYPNVLHITYPTCMNALEGQKSFVYTMFENEKLPSYLVNTLNKQDHIIVPNHHNVQMFKNSGVNLPISVVPFGNDWETYHFLNRNWSISDRNPFTFLIYGYPNWRKGADLAMKAFKTVFPPDKKDVRLIVKVSKQYALPWTVNGMKTSDDRMVLIKENLSEKEMLNLYGMGHCYLGCSRGDAWNLLAFQALATGIPAITTDYCGPVEFNHISFPLKYYMKYSTEKILDEDWGYYGEPDFDHLCELMKYCYDNPEVCRVKGIEASNEIRQNYTWDRTAKELLNVIEMNS
jgi:glycosyltransferase involved in cell wall biosynthesis